jgi:hypothetical protein
MVADFVSPDVATALAASPHLRAASAGRPWPADEGAVATFAPPPSEAFGLLLLVVVVWLAMHALKFAGRIF